MSPKTLLRSTLCAAAFVFLLLLTAPRASAHPVAQGQMNVAISSDHIHITAHVANEQITIATAYGSDLSEKNPEAFPTVHGRYLLDHLFVEADGQLLKGEVTGFEAAATAAPQALSTYQLRFPFPAGVTAPKQLTLRQNILNEIMFAPGNPWEAIFVVTVRQGETTLSEGTLFTHKEAVTVPLVTSGATVATTSQPSLLGQYFHHGLTHILEGWDHLLFVCALVLAVTRISQLLLVVTAFTVAHTLTLVLSVMGLVRLPSGIVEPMIAASIVFVAVQNAFWPERTRGAARLAIAFAFGLFHGLGFAGGLLEAMAGLSPQLITLALIGFAVGVEVGHQIVALPFFGIVHFLRTRQSGTGTVETGRWVPATFQTVSLLIAVAGCFYLVNSLRAA